MRRRTPRFTRTDTLLPYTTIFRSLVGTAHPDAGVDDRIAVLFLLREQVGAGVIVAGHAAIDIDEAGQPAAADLGRPGDAAGRDQFGRVRQIVARPLAQRLVERSEEQTSELQSLMRIAYAVFCLQKKTI